MRNTEAVRAPQWCGRDAGKYFQITEWPAARAEKWAFKALLAYNRGGGQIDVAQAHGMGMEAIALIGANVFLRGQMTAEEIVPVLDELLECVKIIRDPKARDPEGKVVATELVSEDDVEEVRTRLWLRSEVIRIHTGFSAADVVSKLISAIMTPA